MSGPYFELTKQQKRNGRLCQFIIDEIYELYGFFAKNGASTEELDKSWKALQILEKILMYYRDRADDAYSEYIIGEDNKLKSYLKI